MKLGSFLIVFLVLFSCNKPTFNQLLEQSNYLIKYEEWDVRYPEHYLEYYVYFNSQFFANTKDSIKITSKIKSIEELLKYNNLTCVASGLIGYSYFCCKYDDIEKGMNIDNMNDTLYNDPILDELNHQLNQCAKLPYIINRDTEKIKISIWKCNVSYCKCKPYLMNFPNNCDSVITINNIYPETDFSKKEIHNFSMLMNTLYNKHEITLKADSASNQLGN